MTSLTQLKIFDKYLDKVREQRDIYKEMLSHKLSPHTKRAYSRDLKDFFGYFGSEPIPATIKEFLSLTKIDATALFLSLGGTKRGARLTSQSISGLTQINL